MTLLPPRDRTPRTLGGRHVLLAFVGFFAVIVAADATLIYAAVSTFGGLDNRNAYRDGLAYNRRIASDAEQARLGWLGSIGVTGAPARLRVSLTDRSGGAVTGKTLVADIGRPATDRFDVRLPLRETGPGLYEAAIPTAAEGSWVVHVRAFAGTEPAGEPLYQAKRRLWIKP